MPLGRPLPHVRSLVCRYDHPVNSCFGQLRNRTALLHHGAAVNAASNLDSSDTQKSSASSASFARNRNVDVTSLQNTLQAHREANRASLIRKNDGSGIDIPLDLHDSHPEGPNHSGDFTHGQLSSEVIGQYGGVKRVEFSSLSFSGNDALSTRKRRRAKVEWKRQGRKRDVVDLWRVPDHAIPVQQRLPWLQHLDEAHRSKRLSGIARLTKEIQAFDRYVSPTPEEARAADVAMQDVTRVVQQVDEDLDIDIIGSRATGIADPLSDVDVNVTNSLSPLSMHSLKPPHQILRTLEMALRGQHPSIHLKSSPIEIIHNVKQAQVPILLCRHKRFGFPVQIQSTPRDFDRTEIVKAHLHEFPTLRSLFKLLKQLLKIRGLTYGASGGVTSYPLLNMILAALKFSENKLDRSDAGGQLMFFLDMYSGLDMTRQGISLRPLQYFPKASVSRRGQKSDVAPPGELGAGHFARELEGQHQMGQVPRMRDPYLLTLQDPADPFNDLGRRVYRIGDILETLIDIRQRIQEKVDYWDSLEADDGRSRPQSLLQSCLMADYRIYEHDREDLRQAVSRAPLGSGS